MLEIHIFIRGTKLLSLLVYPTSMWYDSIDVVRFYKCLCMLESIILHKGSHKNPHISYGPLSLEHKNLGFDLINTDSR